jgi:hypothetical protein
MIRNEDGRLQCVGGGYHRFPMPGVGSVIREALIRTSRVTTAGRATSTSGRP